MLDRPLNKVPKLAQGLIANGDGLVISPFTNPDMSNAFTSNPNQGSIANGAGKPSTKYPSTTYTQAQIHNVYPDKMCLSHGFDDQKIQKQTKAGPHVEVNIPLYIPPTPSCVKNLKEMQNPAQIRKRRRTMRWISFSWTGWIKSIA